MKSKAIAPIEPFFSITPATWPDLGAIYRLEQSIFPQDAYPYADLLILLSTPGMINLKVITADKSLIGFAAFTSAGLGLRPAWIITVGIARTWQNQGIGGALMGAVHSRSRAKRIRLTVRVGNAPAIHLYEKLGYQHIKRHKSYYPNGEDGFIMELQR